MRGIKLEDIKNVLKNVADVQYREISRNHTVVYVIYIHSLCDTYKISDFIIRPLTESIRPSDTLDTITHETLQSSHVLEVNDINTAVMKVLSGDAVLLFPHLNKAVACEMKGFAKRAIGIPQTETVIKGPREGFTEDINDNVAALRRRIKTPSLKIETFTLGTESQTHTVLIYLEGITPDKLITFVRNKIVSLEKKFVLYTNQIESALRCKGTPFDTIGYTEKADVAASKLSEGRVLIIVDGNPFVITAPFFFIEHFQTTDDYTLNPFMANLGRIFRWTAFFLSTFIPGLYLALVTYHFKLIPTIFLYRLALFRAGVPVPTIVELLYMILFFQIIREAGVRLPQPIGPTLSIVGALILGESAVASGLASQVTVVVVAITSIASYLIPTLHASIFLSGIGIIFISGALGLPGFYMGFALFASHLAGLTSCGYPYLYPFGTKKTFKYSDILVRGSLNEIKPAPLQEVKSK